MDLLQGFTIAIISGVLLGIYALPIKGIKVWNYENYWIIFTLISCIILPLVVLFFTNNQIINIYQSVPRYVIVITFVFGAMWGLANIGFGLSVKLIGISLTTAILLGTNNVLGSILPILYSNPQKLLSLSGIFLMVGILIMIIGIVLCGLAGIKKDKETSINNNVKGNVSSKLFRNGLILSVVAGVFGSMFNFALIAGKPIEQIAIKHGVASEYATGSVWVIALSGGFIITLFYCIYLFFQNHSFRYFKVSDLKANFLLSALMGLMWYGGVYLYGIAALKLGDIGTSTGWPIVQCVAVASGNIAGILSGEWKGASKTTIFYLTAGLIVLFVGIIFVGYSNTINN